MIVNKKQMFFSVLSVGIFFCANVHAMLGLQKAVSRLRKATPGAAGIARRATTEGSQVGRATLLASVRANQGSALRATPLSRGFASWRYDPTEGNEVAARLKSIASYSRIDGIEFVHDRFARRKRDAKRHSVLMEQKQLSDGEQAELDSVERRLIENDQWMFQLRDTVEQSARRSMIAAADAREQSRQRVRQEIKAVMPVVLFCAAILFACCPKCHQALGM